jgi:hypothetical protein
MRPPEKQLGPRRTETAAEKDKARQPMQLRERFREIDNPDKIKRLGDELGQ